MIFILLYIIGCLLITLHIVIQSKKKYYSNYKNCLMALGEYDPQLKAYLESKGE